MKAIFILIIISLLAAIGFLFAFIWAVKTGQYEDDYTPSVRILFEDDQPGNQHKLDLNNNETPVS